MFNSDEAHLIPTNSTVCTLLVLNFCTRPCCVPFHTQLAVHVPHGQWTSHTASCQELPAWRPGHHVDGLQVGKRRESTIRFPTEHWQTEPPAPLMISSTVCEEVDISVHSDCIKIRYLVWKFTSRFSKWMRLMFEHQIKGKRGIESRKKHRR